MASDGISVTTTGATPIPSGPAPSLIPRRIEGEEAPDQSELFNSILSGIDNDDGEPLGEPDATEGDKAPVVQEEEEKGGEAPLKEEGEATEPPTPPEEPPEAVEAAAPLLSEEDAQKLKAETVRGLESFYSMTDEQVEEFQSDPKTNFPKLAAQVHYHATQSAILAANHMIQNMVPQVLQALSANQVASQKAAEEFFAEWPDLRGAERAVAEYGQYWRQRNPRASKADWIKHVGGVVSAQLGRGAAAKPSVQQSPKKVKLPPPNGGAGSAGSSSATKGSGNIWDDIMPGDDD